MKKAIALACLLVSFINLVQSINTVPLELIKNDFTYRSITTASGIHYVNIASGSYCNTCKSGGGMIIKFKFKEGNYIQV